MANLRSIQLCILMISILLDNAVASDPIFKFIPKSSLSSLAVQTESTYDIQMIVGTHAAASTVFRVNGPFQNNNAGMIGVSMTTISKGSNVNAPDFTTAATDQSSTANDGLYDVIYKNFTSITRSVPSTTSYNEVKLEATMKTVDLPGATSSTTLWVWASAEIGDEYVWVSEEATTIQRSNSDGSLITMTTTTPNLPVNTLISGDKLKINGKIEHTSASRLNAYGAIIRLYLPPFAEFVQGSYQTTDPLFPSADVTYNSQNSEKELIMRYSKVGITSKPSFSVEIRLDANTLHLKAGQVHQAKIDVIQSYCTKADCTGNINSTNITIVKNFRRREAGDTFLVQHIASGRCLSYTAGVNSDKITVKASCTDHFTYDSNGGLKHVSSSSCAYEDSGFIKMSTSKCSNATIFYKEISGYLRFFSSPTNCLTAADTGLENKDIKKSSVCSNNEKFKFIDAVPASKRISMGNKAVLASGSAEFFYCNRHSREYEPSCFYRNGTFTSEIKALPVAMAYLKAYNPATKELYGIHYTGKCYVKVQLAQTPNDVFQLEDSLFETIKTKSGMILSTEITESNLQNYPVQHLSTEYAVSLQGIHQKDNSGNWKRVLLW